MGGERMDERGQTTFEYLLLAGGVIVLALLIIGIMSGAIQLGGQELNETVEKGLNKLQEKIEEMNV